MKATQALKAMQELTSQERYFVLTQLLASEDINITGLVKERERHLLKFKEDAYHDIQVLSQAGLQLGESNIKKIPKIKQQYKRILQIAMANTLISTGVIKGTPHEKELKKNISFKDFSDKDKDWYESFWKLRTIEAKS